MDAIWIFAGFTVFLIVFIVLHAMMKKASDERHEEKTLNPPADVFVTHHGRSFRRWLKPHAKPK